MKSVFCQETFRNGAARAFLWHRDLDDNFSPQIKVMVPMVRVNSYNGMFSAMERQVCPLSHSLLDCSDRSSFSFVDKSDADVRIRDDVLRRHFDHRVVDFDASPAEAFVVDTNSVYHKGGMVLVKGRFRVNIQLTIGSSLHSWNRDKTLQRHFLRRISSSIPTGIGHFFIIDRSSPGQ